ncbi:MAG: hypothetical protein NTZ14_08575 [Hyphomicrobiales bacterium]|nr:hypothetical protein [Hyphomicrobiales bacterium]
MTRRGMIHLGLGCALAGGVLAAGHAVRAQTPSQLERQRERLLVSLVALRNGAMVADDSATYTPFHQHREQALSLEIGAPDAPMALLATVWDRDAGGVLVTISAIDRYGVGTDLREFTMYPFVDKAAVRVEPLTLPLMHMVDSRNEQFPEFDRLELHLTMTRVVRQR